MFENNKDTNLENKLGNLSVKDNLNSKYSVISIPSIVSSSSGTHSEPTEIDLKITIDKEALLMEKEKEDLHKEIPETVYKSNINKFNFLQTQLSGDALDPDCKLDNLDVVVAEQKKEDCPDSMAQNVDKGDIKSNTPTDLLKEESNVTDDIRIAQCHSIPQNTESNQSIPSDIIKDEQDVVISVPPRRKKLLVSPEKITETVKAPNVGNNIKNEEKYPDYLNPFSDDEEDVSVLPKNNYSL